MTKFKTPYFLIDEGIIEKNCKVLDRVRKEAGCKILLAQKAYSCYDTYPLIAKYLDGTTASGLFEARLGYESFRATRGISAQAGGSSEILRSAQDDKKETHCFAPAFTDADMAELVKICDHIVFNSVTQLLKHHKACRANNVQISVRVNPECKTQESDIYDPCAPLSRFGIRAEEFEHNAETILPLVDGLHFHTLCEQDLEPLKKTLTVFEQKFGEYIKGMKYVNFGGGHHITRAGYDVDGLIALVRDFQTRYEVQVYLEPGEAVVLDAGTLHSTVLDIVHNGRDIAILDTSAACHNPDIIETQHDYMPPVRGATQGTTGKGFLYRLAGNTCLAGDIIGDYVFKAPLKSGSEIIFENMALYTMVKTNMFNGINLPAIYVKRLNGKIELLCEFGFGDYKGRLGR